MKLLLLAAAIFAALLALLAIAMADQWCETKCHWSYFWDREVCETYCQDF